jgi:hypothetical protein
MSRGNTVTATGRGEPGASQAPRAVLPVDAAGRRGTVREPVERDGVEHVVGAERVLGEPAVVRLGLELLVDPGCLAGRRVRQGEADGLGFRGLQVVRSAEVAGVEGEGLDGLALVR